MRAEKQVFDGEEDFVNIEDAKTLKDAMDDKIVAVIEDFEERIGLVVTGINVKIIGDPHGDDGWNRELETTVVLE